MACTILDLKVVYVINLKGYKSNNVRSINTNQNMIKTLTQLILKYLALLQNIMHKTK